MKYNNTKYRYKVSKEDARIIMIWEEHRIICRLNMIIFFLVPELIQKQVKKVI